MACSSVNFYLYHYHVRSKFQKLRFTLVEPPTVNYCYVAKGYNYCDEPANDLSNIYYLLLD